MIEERRIISFLYVVAGGFFAFALVNFPFLFFVNKPASVSSLILFGLCLLNNGLLRKLAYKANLTKNERYRNLLYFFISLMITVVILLNTNYYA